MSTIIPAKLLLVYKKSVPGFPPKWLEERLKQIEDTLDEVPMSEEQASPTNISERN